MNTTVDLKLTEKDRDFLKNEIWGSFFRKGVDIRNAILDDSTEHLTPMIEEWYQLGRIYAVLRGQSIPCFFDTYCDINRSLPKQCLEFVQRKEIEGDF